MALGRAAAVSRSVGRSCRGAASEASLANCGASLEGVIDVCIVGAGASGLACAVQCARSLRQAGSNVRVVVLDAAAKLGRSILASGNGRCNFSNQALTNPANRSMYRNAEFVSSAAKALAASSEVGVLPWFRELGLVWRSDDAGLGMLYPYSSKASTVLSVLLRACERWGVELVPEVRVDEVLLSGQRDSVPTCSTSVRMDESSIPADKESSCPGWGRLSSIEQKANFRLIGEWGVERSRTKTAKGRIKREVEWVPFEAEARCVVVATGGSLVSSQVPGHSPIAFEPVLAPLEVAGPDFVELDGVRAKVGVTVDGSSYREEGELLFRDYGISGIVSFNLSRELAHGGTAFIDFAPDHDMRELVGLLAFVSRQLGGAATRAVESLLEGMFVPELARCLVRKAKLVGQPATEQNIAKLSAVIKRFEIQVTGVSSANAPQVRRGGCRVGEFDPTTLASRKTPGLYVLGEALDVDAPCGGYNLDWAWTCGILAGQDIAITQFKYEVHQ